MSKSLSSRILAGTFLALLLIGSTPGLATGSVELVSRAHTHGQPSVTPDQQSAVRGVSTDGRYVLFESSASNLIPE